MTDHDPTLEPIDCAAAALHELAHANLTAEDRDRILRHGLEAVHQLASVLSTSDSPELDGTPLPPAPWRWVRLPACSSPADDPHQRTDRPAGTHLIAADGEQLVRSEDGYALLEWWDPARRDWDVDERNPVALLLAAAPRLLAQRDQARAFARRLWTTRGSPVTDDTTDPDENALARHASHGLDLDWFTEPPAPPEDATPREGAWSAFQHGSWFAWNVIAARPVGTTSLDLVFADGLTGTVDLGPTLWGPVFEPVRNDPAFFAQVRVDPEIGTVVWPNDADLAPEALHELVQQANLARLPETHSAPPPDETGHKDS